VIRRRAVLGGLWAVWQPAHWVSRRASATTKLLTVVRRPAETFTLANGLQVVVLASKARPLISQMMVYKAGSADEPRAQSGVAHFLEHMMFKGTSTVPSGDFSRTVSRNGGRDNAFTSYDVTAYHQTIASDRLDLVMRLEADRMSNLIVVQKELVPERQVVLEERRMRTDNVPGELLNEAVRDALFGRGRPYGVPVVGYADEIKKLGVNEISAFYRRHYMPNNAVLIVAGDTSGDAVRKLAERYYGATPPRKSRRASGRAIPAWPADQGDARRCPRGRDALGVRFHRAILPHGRDPHAWRCGPARCSAVARDQLRQASTSAVGAAGAECERRRDAQRPA